MLMTQDLKINTVRINSLGKVFLGCLAFCQACARMKVNAISSLEAGPARMYTRGVYQTC